MLLLSKFVQMLTKHTSIHRFPTFLAVLESKYSGGGSLDINGVTEAIDDLYQIYVEDVIKKVCSTYVLQINIIMRIPYQRL